MSAPSGGGGASAAPSIGGEAGLDSDIKQRVESATAWMMYIYLFSISLPLCLPACLPACPSESICRSCTISHNLSQSRTISPVGLALDPVCYHAEGEPAQHTEPAYTTRMVPCGPGR